MRKLSLLFVSVSLLALGEIQAMESSKKDYSDTIKFDFSAFIENKLHDQKKSALTLKEIKEELKKETKKFDEKGDQKKLSEYISQLEFYLSGKGEVKTEWGKVTPTAHEKAKLADRPDLHWQQLDHIATGMDVLHRLGLNGKCAKIIRLAPDYKWKKEGDAYKFMKESRTKALTEPGAGDLHENHITGILVDSRFGVMKGGKVWTTAKGLAKSSFKLTHLKELQDLVDTTESSIITSSEATNLDRQVLVGEGNKEPSGDKEPPKSLVDFLAKRKKVLFFQSAGNSGNPLGLSPEEITGTEDTPREMGVYFNSPELKDRFIVVGNYRATRDEKGIVLIANPSSGFPFPRNEEDEKSVQSNFIFAPGSDISASVYENDGVIASMFKTGTSMATPYIAGVFVLFKKYFPKLETTTIKEMVFKTAVVEPDSKFKFLNALYAFSGLLLKDMGEDVKSENILKVAEILRAKANSVEVEKDLEDLTELKNEVKKGALFL